MSETTLSFWKETSIRLSTMFWTVVTPPTPKKHDLSNICKDLGLVDAWRLLNPTSRDYTFYSALDYMRLCPLWSTLIRWDLYAITTPQTIYDI